VDRDVEVARLRVGVAIDLPPDAGQLMALGRAPCQNCIVATPISAGVPSWSVTAVWPAGSVDGTTRVGQALTSAVVRLEDTKRFTIFGDHFAPTRRTRARILSAGVTRS